MLRDVRKLLLHVGSSITHVRNNIALRAINPFFSLKPEDEVNYTLPLDEFQNTLIQQTAARKATRDATINKRQHRRFQNGNPTVSNSFSNGRSQQFFRPGPPSQQGGFSNNNTSNNNNSSFSTNNNNSNSNSNNNYNFLTNNSNNNNSYYNNKKNTNPFRQ
ncbi:hypothetical protein BD408DRAFT_413348 [Parasitella parasitica]|nr:hypothetical protein BD408DRAFT_413348 [Parasitella parasitica]